MSVSHDYLKNGWPDDERIDKILAGSEEALPQKFSTAMRLVRQRFGCVFKKLPEEFRLNPKLIMEATIQSSGHELGHAPKEILANLPSEFFIEAMQGKVVNNERICVRGWIIKWASDAVKSNKEIQKMVIVDQPGIQDDEGIVEFINREDPDIKNLIEQGIKKKERVANGEGH